jgi:hypothetical protein
VASGPSPEFPCDALADCRLKGHKTLPAKKVLTVGGVNLTREITAEIELG